MMKPTLTQIQSWMGRLGHIIDLVEDALLVLILTLMIVLATSQILLRNLFDIGLAWGDPLLRLMVLWVGLLGAMVATRDDNHITIDVFYRYLSDKAKIYVHRLTDLFACIVCAIIAWYAVSLVIIEKQEGSIAFSGIPAWITELIIPVAFTAMACRFFVRLFQPNKTRVT